MKDLTTDKTLQQIQYYILIAIITPLFFVAGIAVVIWTLIENILKLIIYNLRQLTKAR